MTTNAAIRDSDMPQLFQAADRASLDGQRSYVGKTRFRLVVLCAAGATGVASWRVGKGDIDLLAVLAVALFTTALYLETLLWRERPDKHWYDGRAVAESAKTLAWKFAVGGNPFPASMDIDAATAGLISRMQEVGEQFPDLELAPVDAPLVSDWMTAQRGSPLEQRRATYLDARIRDQRAWYDAKARYNRRRARRWRTCMVTLELVGAMTSMVQALTSASLVVGPLVAALAGAAVAWLETKQHDSLARAYAAAVADLSRAEAKLSIAQAEDSWAIEVDDAEEAISREHTIWLASRSRV